MNTLVTLVINNISIDELSKIESNIRTLEKEPRYDIRPYFKDKNPEFKYRRIFVSTDNYHVSDIGRIIEVAGTVTLGDRIYTQKEVEELRNERLKDGMARGLIGSVKK